MRRKPGTVPMNTAVRNGEGTAGGGSPGQGRAIDCFSCRFFFITYEQRFPYGCRAARFKSSRMPSREMFANSGMDCQFFAGKEKDR